MLDDYKAHINKLNEAEEVETADNPVVNMISSLGGKIKTKIESLKKKANRISDVKTNDGVDLLNEDKQIIDQVVYILGEWTDWEDSANEHKEGIQAFSIRLTSYENGMYSYKFEKVSDEDIPNFKPFRYDGDDLPADKTKGKYLIADPNNKSLITDKDKTESKEKEGDKCVNINGKEFCIGKEYFTYTKQGENYIVAVVGVTSIDDKKGMLYIEPQKVYTISENGEFVETKDVDMKSIKFLGQDGDKPSTKVEYVTKDKEEVVDMIKYHKKNSPDVQDDKTDYSQVEDMTAKDINEFISELHDKITNEDESKKLSPKQIFDDVSVIYNYIMKSKIDKKSKFTLLNHVKDTITSASKSFDSKGDISKLLKSYDNVKKSIEKND